MRFVHSVLILIIAASLAWTQTRYRTPSPDVVAILDAAPTPYVITSPRGNALLLLDYRPHPSIALLARPYVKLGGLRIDPKLQARQRTREYTALSIRWTHSDKVVPIQLPPNAQIGMPQWSHDGKKIAFTNDTPHGVELWVSDAASGVSHKIPNVYVNDVLTTPFSWTNDNEHLFIHQVPLTRGTQPADPAVPPGPNVEETSGKVSRMATFQDLLRTPFDEDLFQYFATSQLAVADIRSTTVRLLGKPAMFLEAEFSPNEEYLLLTMLKRPFSFRVPCDLFSRTVEVWDKTARRVTTVADLPVSDTIPTQGVPTGPRNVMWRRLQPASLLWVEALDGGDPAKKIFPREKMMGLAAPFTAAPTEFMKVQHRFEDIDWTGRRDEVLLTEYDRDRRWNITALLDLNKPTESRKVLFDLSANDGYKNPGRPVYDERVDGTRVMRQDGDWVFFLSQGASDKGDLPRLDRWNLKTRVKEVLFQSADKTYESVVAFAGNDARTVITRFETQKEPPNFFLMDLVKKTKRPLTEFKDPAPKLTGLQKQLLRYSRPDSVPLSGTLYLPPGYTEGTRLPLIIWAYPLEYSDPATAGQVRGSPYRFTFLRGASPLFFLTQGYAVLMDATMPVVGDPETMNNTFIEQIVSAGRAAIDKLDSMGAIDRKRVCVMGHSYGAFMTANLLAHSSDFAAGIARSGAYNRSLTPFGFQSERRSFWDAPDVYMRVSPFAYAHKIKKPLLLIHGEADNNPGTFTIQSERLFQAIRGNGGTARLVLLPFESHGYVARESVLHTLVEMFEWADKYVKNLEVN
jgi:dipeptidyl aminopeptidase/acylaminoacyl peptidase